MDARMIEKDFVNTLMYFHVLHLQVISRFRWGQSSDSHGSTHSFFLSNCYASPPHYSSIFLY